MSARKAPTYQEYELAAIRIAELEAENATLKTAVLTSLAIERGFGDRLSAAEAQRDEAAAWGAAAAEVLERLPASPDKETRAKRLMLADNPPAAIREVQKQLAAHEGHELRREEPESTGLQQLGVYRVTCKTCEERLAQREALMTALEARGCEWDTPTERRYGLPCSRPGGPCGTCSALARVRSGAEPANA
jgi:hypothetical protein